MPRMVQLIALVLRIILVHLIISKTKRGKMLSAVILAKRRSVCYCAGLVTAWGQRVRDLRGRTGSCLDPSNGQHKGQQLALVLKQG